MLSRTTGDASVEQSAPLTIAVLEEEETDCVTALQALLSGNVGAGVGELGVEDAPPPLPPQAAASASDAASVISLLLISGIFWVR
jgi:hypothetical protein